MRRALRSADPDGQGPALAAPGGAGNNRKKIETEGVFTINNGVVLFRPESAGDWHGLPGA